VLVVVAVNLCVAIKAKGDRILDAVVIAIGFGVDVIRFHLYTAEAVTNTAPTMAFLQQIFDFSSVKGHLPILS
jgi:hypothetical protein